MAGLRFCAVICVLCLTNDAILGNIWTGKLAERFGSVNDSVCSKLTFVTRKQWEAKPPKSSPQPMTIPVGFGVVHHTDSNSCFHEYSCSKLMRAFQTYHMVTKGWNDIAYNFLIGGDQRVYIGRGWDTVGAHAGSSFYNSHSEGIAVIGTYNVTLPSESVLEVLHQLMECGAESGFMNVQYIIRGHRDVRELGPTNCPGDALYAEIRKWPHYNEPYDKKQEKRPLLASLAKP